MGMQGRGEFPPWKKKQQLAIRMWACEGIRESVGDMMICCTCKSLLNNHRAGTAGVSCKTWFLSSPIPQIQQPVYKERI